MNLKFAVTAAILISAAACSQSTEPARDEPAARSDAPRETIAQADAPEAPVAATAPAPLSTAQMSEPEFAGVPAFATRAAFERFLDEQFKAADVDANEMLTETEFMTISASLGAVTAPLASAEIPNASEEKGEAQDATEDADRFAAISGDDDAASKAEFEAAMLAEFDVADANKDNALDDLEQRALAAKLAYAASTGNSPSL